MTGQDGRCDLTVSEKTSASFRVTAEASGEGAFAWRVVAKRKDIAAARFEPVQILKEPTMPPVPDSVNQVIPQPRILHPPAAGAAQRPKQKP